MRRSRILRWLVTIAMVFSLTAWAQAEEVVTAQYPDSNYDPGPGWPEGWTPPPVPAELPEWKVTRLEELMQTNPRFKRYEVRVIDPLPKWTKGYPYVWTLADVPCGDVIYEYWHPDIDQRLILDSWGRDFGSSGIISSDCRFEPIQSITETRTLTPEQKEADARGYELERLVEESNGVLIFSHGRSDNGSPDHIYVYLNDGNASSKFDVPAYLDTSVGRVRVPIRFVSEFMGAEVTWNEATQQVTIHFPALSREIRKAVPAQGKTWSDLFEPEAYYPNDFNYQLAAEIVNQPERTLVLTVGQPSAQVNGTSVSIDAPPVVKQDRTMVPIRFLAEQMGAKVYWVGDQPIFRRASGELDGTYHVHIYTPLFPLYQYPSWYMENRASRF